MKDDLVLVYQYKEPRQKWLLVKTNGLLPGNDGEVRGAESLKGKFRNTTDRHIN